MQNFYNYYHDPDFYIKRETQKNEIKKLGFYAGLALVLQIVIQNALSLIFDFTGLLDKYSTDGSYQNAIDIILVIIGLLVPFYFINKRMENVSGISEPVMLNKPVSKTSFLLAVVAGVGFCMLASLVTSYFTIIIGLFGIELTSPEIAMPKGTLGIVTTFLRVVVLAAVAEEVCMRGYVMGHLRKYGDKFAIIVSATVFAVIHGNLVQSPFALIAGFVIGYFTIKTGSVWTGIAIHAINNFISMAVSYGFDYFGEEIVSIAYSVFLYSSVILAVFAIKAFSKRTTHMPLQEDTLKISDGEKVKAFFLNPAMIILLIYMLYITSLYIGITF